MIDEPGGHFFILIHIPGRLLKAGGRARWRLAGLGAGLHLLLLPLRCGQELKELEYYVFASGPGAWCSSRKLCSSREWSSVHRSGAVRNVTSLKWFGPP